MCRFGGRHCGGGTFLTALILTCALALPGRVAAQAVYGSIGGIVTDTSGGVLPGVTVTITSVDLSPAPTSARSPADRRCSGRTAPTWRARSTGNS